MKPLRQLRHAISTFVHDRNLSLAGWALLLLTAVLLFVFSLPHAMALRKVLLLAAFLIAFRYFRRALREGPKPLLLTVLVVALLQIWMLSIAGFVSSEAWDSFSEWKGQWLPAFMSFVVGIGLAHTLMLSESKDPRVAVAMTIAIPISVFLCVHAAVVTYDLVLVGSFVPVQFGLGGQKGVISYLVSLLAPVLIADLLCRLVRGNRLLPVPAWVISALFILTLISLIAASSRNGLLIMALALVLGASIMLFEIRKSHSAKKVITAVFAALTLVSAIALVSYKIDPRWKTLFETVPIAWDIDHDSAWLDGNGSNLPLTPSGEPVDASEYYRIAWLHEGWRMLLEHPWGLEISRDTFYKLETAKYGHAGMAHSHNSWIDLGLQVGVPGLLLWGWALLLLAQLGWRAWRTRKEPIGIALAVMVIMFAVHGLIDSIFRDHEIEQFMLVAGLLLGALTTAKTNISRARL